MSRRTKQQRDELRDLIGTRRPGRPDGSGLLRTPEVIEELLAILSDGGTISEWCARTGIARRTLNTWRSEDRELEASVARARELGAEAIEEEFAEVVRKPELVVNIGTEEQPKLVTSSDDVGHRKLRAWGLEKRLIWNNSRRYGAKAQVEHTGKLALEQLVADVPEAPKT